MLQNRESEAAVFMARWSKKKKSSGAKSKIFQSV